MVRSGDAALLAAARWALFAEQAVRYLHDAESVVNADLSHLTGHDRADALRARLDAQKVLPTLRARLFPGDE